MSAESPDQLKEKASLLDRVGKTLFPENHLAPWSSILEKREAAAQAGLLTVADIADELDRRRWMDARPDKPLPKELESGTIEEDEKNEFSVEFATEEVRGASGMFAFCARALAIHSHDLAPSVKGVGRVQGLRLGQAQGTALAIEPKKPSLLDRLRGKGGEEKKISGGA